MSPCFANYLLLKVDNSLALIPSSQFATRLRKKVSSFPKHLCQKNYNGFIWPPASDKNKASFQQRLQRKNKIFTKAPTKKTPSPARLNTDNLKWSRFDSCPNDDGWCIGSVSMILSQKIMAKELTSNSLIALMDF